MIETPIFADVDIMVITRSGGSTDTSSNNPDINTACIIDPSSTEMAAITNPQIPIIPQEEVTNSELKVSIQSLIDLVQTNNATMNIITDDIHDIKKDILDIKEVTNESEGLKEQLYSTQGKIIRLEGRNQQLEEKLLAYESKSFQKDLMFYNVEDDIQETNTILKDTLYRTMRDTMKIPEANLFNKKNLGGEIRLDIVSRIGNYRPDKMRPIVATFLTQTGRNMVYSKEYTVNLKNPTKVRVAEHYPSIIREKRQCQITKLRQLRVMYEETETNVKLSKDKILVNGVERNTHTFERNQLDAMSPLSINFDKLKHSNIKVDKRSTFQAHSLKVHSLEQAVAAKNAIYQNPKLADASHIMYAYKIGGTGDAIESGFFDDSEIQGGSKLMELINDENAKDIFICVTRLKRGSNIGPARFTHIVNCAKEVIDHTDRHEDPTFNRIVFDH